MANGRFVGRERILVRPVHLAPGVCPVGVSCGRFLHAASCGMPPAAVKGPVEADPEYKLIVDANNLVVEVDNESSECLRG